MAGEQYDYEATSRLLDVVVRKTEEHGLKADDIDEGINVGSGLGAVPEENMNLQNANKPSGPRVITYPDAMREAGMMSLSDRAREFLFRLFHSNGKEDDTGHAKRLIIGPMEGLGDKPLIIQDGREHLYEGTDPKRAVVWLRLMQLLGIQTLIGSNAAGIVTPQTLEEVSVMLITDFMEINCGDANSLKGSNEPEFGERFPPMSAMYNPEFFKGVLAVAKEAYSDLTNGIYIKAPGPNYETIATVLDMRARLEGLWEQGQKQPGLEQWFEGSPRGAVGMSSTYELLAIMHAMTSEKHPAFQNLVLYFSALTNYAASLGQNGLVNPLSHREVKENGEKVKAYLVAMIKNILAKSRAGEIPAIVKK